MISGQGHEGAQVGIAWPLEQGPRLDGPVLPLGRDLPDLRHEPARHHDRPVRARRRPLARAGARCPATTGSHEHNILSVSSPVATQLLHAVGHRAGRQDPQDRPGGDDLDGRGLVATRATSTRASTSPAIHQLPFVFVVENNGYAISVPMALECRSPTSPSARRLRHAGRRRRRRGRARLLRGGAEAIDSRARRRRADADRGQGHPPDRPLLGRPADQVPLRRGAGGRDAATIRCRASASSSATPAC